MSTTGPDFIPLLTVGTVVWSIIMQERRMTPNRALSKSPWLIIDNEVRVGRDYVVSPPPPMARPPVKFYRFLNSFFDG